MEMGLDTKQAVLLKDIAERIVNGSNENSFQEPYQCERRYGKLQDYKELGRGTFGTVYRVTSAKRKEERALKVMFSDSMEQINESLREAFQLINVKHEYIVKVYDTFVSEWKEKDVGGKEKDVVCIEMEYMKHGSLSDHFTKTKQTAIPEEVILSIIHQVSTALKYLQEHFNMVHRDIKPGNILIKKLEGNTIHVCLSDFGFAKTYDYEATAYSSMLVGTLNFCSPELYKSKQYTQQSDVFALGLTIYQLMTGDIYSHGATLSESGVVRKELVSKMKLKCSESLIDLIVDMMNADPTKRPSLDQLIQSSKLVTSDIPIGLPSFEKDNSNDFQSLLEKSKQGDPTAQVKLAFMYQNGEGVRKDLRQAFAWYEKSANQGNSRAQNNLALMYMNGEGVKMDLPKAFEWYEKSANLGDSLAQYNMGLMNYHGHGVEKDFFKAFKWFKKAAKQGNADAQFNLALMYQNGEGVEKDIYKAFKWFEILAKQGHSNAQCNVGVMYLYGDGVIQDYNKAMEWLTKAAQQGDQKAELCLNLIKNRR